MAFYSYLSTKIIIAFITKSYQDLFGVRSYINALFLVLTIKIQVYEKVIKYDDVTYSNVSNVFRMFK